MIELGVLINHKREYNMEDKFREVKELGFNACQLCSQDPTLWTDEAAEAIKSYMEKYDVKISTFWCGWGGPRVWDLYQGPMTLGIVPVTYRYQRMQDLMNGADFAKKLGVVNVATHAGFIPENPLSGEYQEVVCALRVIAQHLKKNGQYFMFETGQETPVTLRRAILDIGLDNLGVNFDPANLICYGKANPLDALDILGPYIRDFHAKDSNYPLPGALIGLEEPLGQGAVNIPAFIAKVKAMGYEGPMTIEREITGEKQIKDILMAKEMLENLINN